MALNYILCCKPKKFIPVRDAHDGGLYVVLDGLIVNLVVNLIDDGLDGVLHGELDG